MSLTRILVHFDGTPRGERALATALTLAQTHDAHLIGCSIQSEPRIPTYAAAQIPPDVITSLIDEQRRIVEAAHTAFDKIVRASGWFDRSEFISETGDMARALSSQGRGCDLIVLGQSEPGKESTEIEELPDNLVVESGRPVLIVPYIGQRETLGKTVLLCWTDTRESARALSDSLPLLSQASSVIVVTVGAPDVAAEVAGDAAVRYLASHGIRAESRRIVSPEVDVASAILNEAADTVADLIIMGAYGHSRWRETILGGTTRTLMKDMTTPVLMSH